jgi:hypothetical protein
MKSSTRGALARQANAAQRQPRQRPLLNTQQTKGHPPDGCALAPSLELYAGKECRYGRKIELEHLGCQRTFRRMPPRPNVARCARMRGTRQLPPVLKGSSRAAGLSRRQRGDSRDSRRGTEDSLISFRGLPPSMMLPVSMISGPRRTKPESPPGRPRRYYRIVPPSPVSG